MLATNKIPSIYLFKFLGQGQETMGEQPRGLEVDLFNLFSGVEKEPQLACVVVLVPSYIFYWVSQRTLLKWVGSQPAAAVSSLPVELPSFVSHFLPLPASLCDFCSSNAELPVAFHSHHTFLCL